MPNKTMTPQELNEAIAKSRDVPNVPRVVGGPKTFLFIPDYCNDITTAWGLIKIARLFKGDEVAARWAEWVNGEWDWKYPKLNESVRPERAALSIAQHFYYSVFGVEVELTESAS